MTWHGTDYQSLTNVFFFQAEDGIRDVAVTGVQTCALPIYPLNRVPDGAPTPERLTQSIELRKQMEQALAALSDAERTAFVMRHWEGCGIEEIAGVLKSSSNATKNTVFRAVQKLRRGRQPRVERRG